MGNNQNLPYPIKKEISIGNNRIVLLKLPPKVIYNRNVFCIDAHNNVLWQIEELSFYPSASKECHFSNMEFKDGILILWNWCNLRLEVDPKSGAILKKEEIRS